MIVQKNFQVRRLLLMPIRSRNEREFPEEIVQTGFHHSPQRTGRVKGNTARGKDGGEDDAPGTCGRNVESRVKSSRKSAGLKFEASPFWRTALPYLRDFQLRRLDLDAIECPLFFLGSHATASR